MKQFPSVLFKLKMAAAHILGLPAFFLCFVLIFHPAEIESFFETQVMDSGFNLVMVSCIILLTLLCTRTALHFLKGALKMNLGKYIIWCVAETVIIALFMSLYLLLMHSSGLMYFAVVGKCVPFAFEILVIPYTILGLLAFALEGAPADNAADEESLLRFKDSSQRLKLAIASSAILYIAAEENYVRIYYLDGDKVKTYVLRSSMRSIEPLVTRHGIIRCHRSYYVNPQHVALLRKDKDLGAIADLDAAGADSIPVSKSYYETIAKLL